METVHSSFTAFGTSGSGCASVSRAIFECVELVGDKEVIS